MSSSDETDDPIIDFKQPPRYTNLDYREKLSLRANEVSEMRVLCPAISDEYEFEITIIACLRTLTYLKDNGKILNPSSSSNSSRSNSSSDSSSSDDNSSSDDTSDSNSSSSDGTSSISFSGSNSFLSHWTDADDESGSYSDWEDNDSLDQRNFEYNWEDDSSVTERKETKKKRRKTNLDSDVFNVESDIFKQELTSANNERADDPSDQYGIFISVFAAALGCSIIDLDQFCTQLLDLTAIRRSEWDEIKLSINSPKRNRTIAELGINCYHYTRFNEDDLRELCTKFFG